MPFNSKNLMEAVKTVRFFAANEVYCLEKSKRS